jgi:hypothetical protein
MSSRVISVGTCGGGLTQHGVAGQSTTQGKEEGRKKVRKQEAATPLRETKSVNGRDARRTIVLELEGT